MCVWDKCSLPVNQRGSLDLYFNIYGIAFDMAIAISSGYIFLNIKNLAVVLVSLLKATLVLNCQNPLPMMLHCVM